jgi:hypothetical protein
MKKTKKSKRKSEKRKNLLTAEKNAIIVKVLVEEQILFHWEYRPKYPKRANFIQKGGMIG